jgi:hypothetical protein
MLWDAGSEKLTDEMVVLNSCVLVVYVHPCSVLEAEATTYVQKGFREHLLCVVEDLKCVHI